MHKAAASRQAQEARAGGAQRSDRGGQPASTALNVAETHVPFAAVASALGGIDGRVGERLLSDLVSIIEIGDLAQDRSEAIAFAAAFIDEVRPRSTIEAMLAIQMLGCHAASIATTRRGLHPDQSPSGRQQYLSLAGKLMRTFAQQMEALARGRGEATTQIVRVEKVEIRRGSRAGLGSVAHQPTKGGSR